MLVIVTVTSFTTHWFWIHLTMTDTTASKLHTLI